MRIVGWGAKAQLGGHGLWVSCGIILLQLSCPHMTLKTFETDSEKRSQFLLLTICIINLQNSNLGTC